MLKILKSREALLATSWLALIAIAGIITPNFVTIPALRDLLTDLSILMVLALAQMIVILIRGIDLSVAANLAFTGMMVALLAVANPGLPTIVWPLLCIIIGTFVGMFNGLLISELKIPPIVVTLGTMSVWRGMIFVVSGGAWVVQHQFPEGYLAVPRAPIFGLTLFFWIGLLVTFCMWLMTTQTRFGRELYGMGGNPKAAEYAGVRVKHHEFWVYTLTGALSGLCGWLWTSRYAMANTDVALGFELQTVAACVIGGVAISGGAGTVIGAVFGALFLGTLYNILPVIGVSQFWQQALSGAIILIAVYFNMISRKPPVRRILPMAAAEGAEE
ncbi:ABC transporter permease [uncultured Cohaesibacter sp.]|uniref:ABC transporter permease n=1 Tax=uncultured Cohaesibacter sp. TaxID=1002546 RepID=UPI0029C67B69|nr:ABC transporter permease [uncultured Cohaesibacter sp.]